MSPCRVLVIEDDAEIRSALVDVLEDNGYQISAANNGKVALDLLAAAEQLPDVILLDLMMPVMDGASFRREQLARPALSPIPVVVISAFHQAGDAARALQATALVPKPIDLDQLLAAIGGACPQPTG